MLSWRSGAGPGFEQLAEGYREMKITGQIKPIVAGLAGLCLALAVSGTGLPNQSGALAGISARKAPAARAEGAFADVSCLSLKADDCFYPVVERALLRIGGSDRYQTAALLVGARFISAETERCPAGWRGR